MYMQVTRWAYLSIAIAIKVRTLTEIVQVDINMDIIQARLPNHQNWYIKNNTVNGMFKMEIRKSATAKFTRKKFVTVRMRLCASTIHMTIRFPPAETRSMTKKAV